jgi:hypothetical protein
MWALALAVIVQLQGCAAVSGRDTMQLDPIEQRLDLPQQRGGGVVEPTCGAMFSIGKGDAAMLLGLLVLASPFLIVYGVLSAPFALLNR